MQTPDIVKKIYLIVKRSIQKQPFHRSGDQPMAHDTQLDNIGTWTEDYNDDLVVAAEICLVSLIK